MAIRENGGWPDRRRSLSAEGPADRRGVLVQARIGLFGTRKFYEKPTTGLRTLLTALPLLFDDLFDVGGQPI